jgi:hypothetical protein
VLSVLGQNPLLSESEDFENNLIREMHKGKKINLKAPLVLLLVNGRNPSQHWRSYLLRKWAMARPAQKKYNVGLK